MAKCVYKQRQDVIICSGDLNKQISIQTRKLVEPSNFDDDVDYSEEFTVFQYFWAMIETVNGEAIFDESNTKINVTHKFYIRYVSDITFENWVVYSGNRFRILDVENINEQNEFLILKCNKRGSVALPVNEQ